MVAPSAGTVVLVTFPFSDLTQNSDPLAVLLINTDFQTGSLHLTSYARPGKLFTANQTLIAAEVGRLTDEAFRRVASAVIDLLRASLPP